MRIVLAVDGSPGAVQARDLLASLPLPEHTEVTLVTAYPLPSFMLASWGGGGQWLEETIAAYRREAEEMLGAIGEPLVARGIAVRHRVEEGRPADVILDVADDVDADLIVLGSRGHGRIASMLLGSVSAEVGANARRSVLVARGGAVSRLLVATDGTPCAEAIVDVLEAWGVFRGLPGIALSVAPVDSPAYELMVALYTAGAESQERQQAELHELHRGYAQSMAQALHRAGIPVEAQVRTGDAAREITAAVREKGIDLVVTGSRCLKGLDRWLLGSVARNVLVHAASSVLIVRPAHGGAPAEAA